MSKCGCSPIKLHLQKQAADQIWLYLPAGCYSLILGLEYDEEMLKEVVWRQAQEDYWKHH